MPEKEHYTVVDYLQYGLGGVISLAGARFMFTLPPDPTIIHVGIIGGCFLIGGAMLKIPGFRTTLSRAVERFVPKAPEEIENKVDENEDA